MKTSSVFVAIDCKEQHPIQMGTYHVLINGKYIYLMEFDGIKFDNGEDHLKYPTHWLEEKKEAFVLTSDERIEDIKKAMVEMSNYYTQIRSGRQGVRNFIEEYLSNLKLPPP